MSNMKMLIDRLFVNAARVVRTFEVHGISFAENNMPGPLARIFNSVTSLKSLPEENRLDRKNLLIKECEESSAALIKEVIFTPSLQPSTKKEIVEICKEFNAQVKIIRQEAEELNQNKP